MRDETLHLRIEPDGAGGFRLIKNGVLVPGDMRGLVAYITGEADVALSMSPLPATSDWVHEDGRPIRLELVLGGYQDLPAPDPEVISPLNPSPVAAEVDRLIKVQDRRARLFGLEEEGL